MAASTARNPFGSRQETFADIQVLEINIHGDVKYYLERLDILKQWEKAISPLEIILKGYHIHVTPLGKEIVGLHILRLFNPDDKRYRVDLFFRDVDLYFVAFCVEMVPSEEERARGATAIRSPCFKFKDEDNTLPDFLNAEVIDMGYSYGPASEFMPGGGPLAMEYMFYAFTRYSTTRRVNLQFRRAVYSVMGLYSEARRLLSARTEMSHRIACRSLAMEVSDTLRKRIHCWTKLGVIVLEDLSCGCLALENGLPHWCHKYQQLSFMGNLIGFNGEVLIIRSDEALLRKILGISDREFNRLWNEWRVGAPHNPDFVIPQQVAGAYAP